MTNIAINGAGRIGLLFLRAVFKTNDPNLKIVMINDKFMNLKSLVYRLKFDSVHGRFPFKIDSNETDQTVTIDGKHVIHAFSEGEPEKLDYDKFKVDVVVECTGVFTEFNKAKRHMANSKSVKHVVISAPASGDEVKTIVFGVNHSEFDKEKHKVVSNASCTTNCMAPMVKVLDEAFGVVKGHMTTVHAATATQKTVDGIGAKALADGRGLLNNIIPSSTGAAKAIGLVIPHLNGKLTGVSLRVPTSDVSIVDFTVVLKKSVSTDEVNKAFEDRAKNDMAHILGIAEEGAVSTDFLGDTKSCTFEPFNTKADGDLVKVFGFYDNEVGYSQRLMDLVKFIGSKY